MNKQINCSSLHSFSSNDNRFVKLGSIPNTNHIFECGINNNGNDEINAYINADGTCSFVNSDVVTNFTSLNDVPHNYIEKSNHILIVDENEKCIKCVLSYTGPKQSQEGPRLSEPTEVRQQALPSLVCRNI